jgi:molybdopterin-containing oxidoreductase family iron-sulfur binding subunit
MIDLTSIRERLAQAGGRTYWRSLEELAGTPAFQEYLHREFPSQASEFSDPAGRRQFLKLMAASLALAGAGACTRQPAELIVPYVRPPEELVPGKPLFFATAMPMGGSALGLLVESHMGRPTKVEGNPDHPASLGATDIFAQASILSLYDPDRSQTLTHLGEVRPWGAFLGSMQATVAAARPNQGAALRILTGHVSSPTLADLLRTFLAEFPRAKWHQYEPVNPDMSRAGARAVFGRPLQPHYRFAGADVILSLDADVLGEGPAGVRYTRDVTARRRVENGAMNRLYVVESTVTCTGSLADHRLPLRASEVESFAHAVAAGLGVVTPAAQTSPAGSWSPPAGVRETWIPALLRDLQQHRGRSAIVAGDLQPPAVHALAHAMNSALGNVGTTVFYTDPVEATPVDQTASLVELVRDIDAGQVDVLIVLGGNPVYTAPADLAFAERLRKVRLRVHLGLYDDETAELCQWHVPEAHYLETWGDVRAYDGTVSIVQPLIAPLYFGRSPLEVLAALSPQPDRSAHDIVRSFWQRTFEGRAGTFGPLTSREGQPFRDFDRFWRRALHDGLVAGSSLPIRTPEATAAPAAVPGTPPAPQPGEPPPEPGAGELLEIVFRPDPTIHDGRFANNGWLQELPKPVTKLTWENVAHVSPATAAGLHVVNGDVVRVTHRGRSILAPIWILPGHPSGALTLHLGYGRRRAGRVGSGLGYDAYAIRTSQAPWFSRGARVERTGERILLANTQGHFAMENRNLVRAGTAEEYAKNPGFVHEMAHAVPKTLTLYPEHEYDGYKWGMAVDLSTCTGCSACVVACVAENNIPVVGKEQVLGQREMHWLRIDAYYEGPPDAPAVYHQPVPCMHCENAPCEVVCPVAATVHSAEGLNDMVYNRCVGTRYCSNNCPYKVRRFNFFLYQDWTTPSLKLARNPDVTVRSRGVMEKCTYCVQRINHARIEAEQEGRRIRDGEVVTACQGACPADAIVFGDLNDPASRVVRLKAEQRNYGLLEDLNTRPRTTYLAALKNPNPEIEPPATRERAGHGATPEH